MTNKPGQFGFSGGQLRRIKSIAAVDLPATGKEGDIYYVQEADIFYYWDSLRSNFLSVETFAVHSQTTLTTASSHFLRFAGSAYSSTNGFVLPRNATVVGASCFGGSNGTVQYVLQGLVSVGTVGTYNASNMIITNALNFNLSSSTIYEVYDLGGSSFEKCLLYFKWRR